MWEGGGKGGYKGVRVGRQTAWFGLSGKACQCCRLAVNCCFIHTLVPPSVEASFYMVLQFPNKYSKCFFAECVLRKS